MSFNPVDMERYSRRAQYEEFLTMKLTYSATVHVDITALRETVKRNGFRTYPAQLWLLITAANRSPEFRMSHDNDGRLGIWDEVSPLYTVFAPAEQTFSAVWTPYRRDFRVFHERYLADTDRSGEGTLTPQPDIPANVIHVSSIPWVAFTAFNLNLADDDLRPILTIGKHVERDGRTMMPLAIQVHHAVCDGWHLGQFVTQVQEIADDAANWISR